MCAGSVQKPVRFLLQIPAPLVGKDTEAFFIKTWQQHRKQLARVGLEGNVQIQILIADPLRTHRAHAYWCPLATQLRARAVSHLIFKLKLGIGNLLCQRPEVFLYASTLTSSFKVFAGRAVVSLIFNRAHIALTPPIVYLTPHACSI